MKDKQTFFIAVLLNAVTHFHLKKAKNISYIKRKTGKIPFFDIKKC